MGVDIGCGMRAAERVRRLVKTETDRYGWEFLYLGANIDAFAAASSIGIDASRAANFVADAKGARTNFEDMADAVLMARTMPRAARRAKWDAGNWKRRTDEDYRKRENK